MTALIALVALCAAAVVLVVTFGSLRWRTRTAHLTSQLRGQASSREGVGHAIPDLDGLPAPVARYFRTVLPNARAPIVYARLEQRGEFLVRPGPNGWRPFTAVEHFTSRPAGFVWDAAIRMAAGVPVFVRDGFVAGRGSMTASVLGIRRVVSIEGTPAIASGALQRYLAEVVWLPTALLPSAGVAWTALGPASARATLTAGATTVSVDFHFGADGLVERIYTASRERDVGGGRTLPTPWQGSFARYDMRDGVCIPLEGEVAWLLPEGPQPYWRGEITGVTYEPAADLAPAPGRAVD
jgi:hypothetical protein